ncbi:hypothetical protein Ahy_A04g020386 [Arachis hypogaea]|uniref:Nucleotide-diphospho-sugar transferase domain-containing protein n=1 Tax=Arachis hypogaea TaxID=3818 RepID=A0A445DHL2_ARAHY|nr:hypothetical protein Ahy_A04g020386 [Arachis hypogaea]
MLKRNNGSEMGYMQMLTTRSRHRSPMKKPTTMILLLCIFLLSAYYYFIHQLIIKGTLGHEGKFSVYVHSSKTKPLRMSRYFINQDIPSDEVHWGNISMFDAERRLLANALQDPHNQRFVLLSDSFEDIGPQGNGRYSRHMLPEIQMKDFRKGGQWFTLKRQHALVVIADNLYYSKFRAYCKLGFEGKYCIVDEQYLPTLFNIVDPGGIANWSVTHVDWSKRGWHPKTYGVEDVTYQLLNNISSVDVSMHVTSNMKKEIKRQPCLWNGIQRPCYLFARKFTPQTIDKLLHIFSNYSIN